MVVLFLFYSCLGECTKIINKWFMVTKFICYLSTYFIFSMNILLKTFKYYMIVNNQEMLT
jgi:hypothetical protein